MTELPRTRTLNNRNTTGYTGVSYNKSKQRFIASVMISGKPMHLGTFKTAEEAYAAYLGTLKKYGVLK